MTSHLKVDGCSSRCTTPSERPDTQMVSVKVGCLHVNPATKQGRRTLLFHMLVLCFVPHAALVAQNCTIMAQLSHTLDSSLFLHSKASMTLTLENTVEAIQEERVSVAKYLFLKSRETMEKEDVVDLSAVQSAFSETDVLLDELSPPMIRDEHKLSLYHFREDVKNFIDLNKADSLKRMAVYGEFNRTLLLYIMRYVRFTTSALWRHLSTSYELLKSMEEVSLALVAALFLSSEDFDVETSSRLQKHHQLALERLQAAVQYLEAEELFDKAKTLMEIIVFYEESAREMSNPAATRSQRGIDLKFYTHQSNACLNKLKNVKNAYWDIIRDSVRVEMWQARRTLAIGVAILVTVLLASPVLVLMLRHTVHTIQIGTFGKNLYVLEFDVGPIQKVVEFEQSNRHLYKMSRDVVIKLKEQYLQYVSSTKIPHMGESIPKPHHTAVTFVFILTKITYQNCNLLTVRQLYIFLCILKTHKNMTPDPIINAKRYSTFANELKIHDYELKDSVDPGLRLFGKNRPSASRTRARRSLIGLISWPWENIQTLVICSASGTK
ncbi:hypothetical protein ABMA27_016413 [Loxostege sticticalis]|uniref:Uncharacterized protein n=1 Tax=Loxostege sticticalis TaxID=481309 RepID=A0ABR3I2D5_LOXSC